MSSTIEPSNCAQHLAPSGHSKALASSEEPDKERLKEEQNPLPTKFINEAESVDCDKKSALPEPEKKGGRRKINIEFIENKNRRHVTFSKRKTGLIKKAYELSALTGTEILLLVVSESRNVYSFATPKLQPFVTEDEGKFLIHRYLSEASITPNQTPDQEASASQLRRDTSHEQKAV